MDFLEFVKHPDNGAFLLSILIMIVMAVVEIITMVLGVSISEAVDNLLPDFDLDADINGAEVGGAIPILDWLNFGKVPFLVLIILFLTLFGLSGFVVQGFIYKIFQHFLPHVLAILLACFISIFLVHFSGNIICRILPQVETTAVKLNTLLGSIAEITLGKASVNNPAEAKAKDRYGKVHYVRVEPEDNTKTFIKGDKVLLVFYENGIFKAEEADISIL